MWCRITRDCNDKLKQMDKKIIVTMSQFETKYTQKKRLLRHAQHALLPPVRVLKN